ncbi:MAG TPA: AAA family ATPase [Dermatophilaceae bacterium]|nr:AAA family ATPase [Dermatophilaceae bacterium]
MTISKPPGPANQRPDQVASDIASEIASEQAHVDRVYAELAKVSDRIALVEAEGLARGRTDRTGDVRDEEASGLFERDALVFNATKRRATLDNQYEGLVFGRLDLQADQEREVRYVGRLGVRDDDYEPLVIDWRAPAASAFYRATPVEPMGVLRRRVLRCKGADVVGVEDDLMVAVPPEDLVVVGDGALMAALTRARGDRMRDIVATIQRHQDEAIRAPARGVTEITGGPGTGKTVVALHRAAYLLYSERRRFESGGILVVGPSASYTAYIERVLPSLGEETVTLRSLGDVVQGLTATRLDPPEVAALKGTTRIRRVLSRAAADAVPDAPTQFRAFVAGRAVRLDSAALDQVRARALRHHQRNQARDTVVQLLAEAAWSSGSVGTGDRAEFVSRFQDHLDVEAFLQAWWPPLDAREVLLWLADHERVRRYAAGVFSSAEADMLAASMSAALDLGSWSVADAALVDDLVARLGLPREEPAEERGFYQVEELDDVSQYGVSAVGGRTADVVPLQAELAPTTARERLLAGGLDTAQEYAHVLIDEAQDISPMQWRMIGRRGRWASWTVVGDAAQASWADLAEAGAAREQAFAGAPLQRFHMGTNYRNAREIFDHAAAVIRAEVPDADIPDAVRETGVDPVIRTVPASAAVDAVTQSVEDLLDQVEGSIAVIGTATWTQALAGVAGLSSRVQLTTPMATKGLEYDATVVVDPDRIVAESPGGVRVLYVALTRAAHRMTVVTVR